MLSVLSWINPRNISISQRPPVFSLKLICINDLIFSRPHARPHARPHVRPHLTPHLRPHVGVMFSVECLMFSVERLPSNFNLQLSQLRIANC